MMGLLEDLRGALRAQRRVLGSTALIVVALGVGIGSSTAVFSALRVVLIPEYPFADPDRLVLIEEAVEGQPGRLTVPDVQTLVASGRSMEGVAAYRTGNLNLTGIEIPERITGAYVTSNFFDLLGVRPALGTRPRPGASTEPSAGSGRG